MVKVPVGKLLYIVAIIDDTESFTAAGHNDTIQKFL
jgi:hypothetical protein